MVPPGTPERNREIRLAFRFVRRHQQREQIAEPRQELLGDRLLQEEPGNGRIATGQRPELVDPVGVRKEATVEHEVDVDREPVLVAKAENAHLHRAVARLVAEGIDDAIAELVDGEVRGVDDHVGLGLDDLEGLTFRIDRSRQTVFGRPGVGTAAALVPGHECRRSGLQEDNPNST